MSESNKTFAFLRRKARESAATRWSRRELAQVALMKGAHQESIAPLLRDCHVKVLAGGEVLMEAGELCQALYLVLSGRLLLESNSSTISDTSIRAGDCIGELFLLQRASVAATITAAETTRLLVIDRATAWALIRGSHEIARNWLALISERTDASAIIGSATELKTTHGTQSTYDECTGLPNRTWLESMLPRLISRSSSNGMPLGLLLAEIDGFADYTSRFGIEASDSLCRSAAKILIASVRPTDLVASLGAAQFAVVLPEADIAGVCLAGERVRQAINRTAALIADESGRPALTVSLGATQFQPSTNAATFLTAAETALRMARTSGGNRVGMQ